MSKEKPVGYWNGKPVEYSVLIVEITNKLPGSMPWCKPFIGNKHQAVKIMVTNHQPFYLDNEDGSGLVRVLEQQGPKGPHLSLGEPNEIKEVPIGKWNTKLDKKIAKRLQNDSDAYWKKTDPEGFKLLRRQRNSTHGGARHGSVESLKRSSKEK